MQQYIYVWKRFDEPFRYWSVPSLVESHNFLSRFGSLLVWVAGCHHDVTCWPWYLFVTTYRIGNHVYYWVWLRPDRLMWRIQQQQQHTMYDDISSTVLMLRQFDQWVLAHKIKVSREDLGNTMNPAKNFIFFCEKEHPQRHANTDKNPYCVYGTLKGESETYVIVIKKKSGHMVFKRVPHW